MLIIIGIVIIAILGIIYAGASTLLLALLIHSFILAVIADILVKPDTIFNSPRIISIGWNSTNSFLPEFGRIRIHGKEFVIGIIPLAYVLVDGTLSRRIHAIGCLIVFFVALVFIFIGILGQGWHDIMQVGFDQYISKGDYATRNWDQKLDDSGWQVKIENSPKFKQTNLNSGDIIFTLDRRKHTLFNTASKLASEDTIDAEIYYNDTLTSKQLEFTTENGFCYRNRDIELSIPIKADTGIYIEKVKLNGLGHNLGLQPNDILTFNNISTVDDSVYITIAHRKSWIRNIFSGSEKNTESIMLAKSQIKEFKSSYEGSDRKHYYFPTLIESAKLTVMLPIFYLLNVITKCNDNIVAYKVFPQTMLNKECYWWVLLKIGSLLLYISWIVFFCSLFGRYVFLGWILYIVLDYVVKTQICLPFQTIMWLLDHLPLSEVVFRVIV